MIPDIITRAWKGRKEKKMEKKAGKLAEKQRVHELNKKNETLRLKVMEIYGWIRLREDMDKFDALSFPPLEEQNPFDTNRRQYSIHPAGNNPDMDPSGMEFI